MKTVVKNTSNLTYDEKRSCRSLSYRSGGDLYWWLKDANVGSKTVMVKDNDGLIIGWGIRESSGEVGFWTRSSYRKKGIGTKMVNRLAKIGPIYVKPHSLPAQRLFASTGQVTCAKDYECMSGFEKLI